MEAQTTTHLAKNTIPDNFKNKTYQKPSERIIPAVPSEYYIYSSKFTTERPVYALLKCKANKNRAVASLKNLGREASLLFVFRQNQIQVCPIKIALDYGLPEHFVDFRILSDTWIGVATITKKLFHKIREMGEISELKRICRTSCVEPKTPILLKRGSIITMMTSCGKYGMFLVNKVAKTSIEVDACHILL
ncbi:MAG: hypothetical protein ABIG87_00555 [Patescibacteria group bacterium]